MPGPNSQVADLIMQLMMRGKSGGLPMQASPELTQYLAHAQGGTTPPQMRGMPSADVLPGPGSAMAELRDPNFLPPVREMSDEEFIASLGGPDAIGETFTFRKPKAPDPTPMDLMSDRPPVDAFRHAGGDGTEDQLFIWAMKNGKRIKLDGPFTDDFTAARELKAMRAAGLDLEVEIGPDFG